MIDIESHGGLDPGRNAVIQFFDGLPQVPQFEHFAGDGVGAGDLGGGRAGSCFVRLKADGL